jgi:hypothetical protein
MPPILKSRQKAKETAMTHTLVASDRVEAAPVFGRDGQKIGTIERLMLDKMTGIVAYARELRRISKGSHASLSGAMEFPEIRCCTQGL